MDKIWDEVRAKIKRFKVARSVEVFHWRCGNHNYNLGLPLWYKRWYYRKILITGTDNWDLIARNYETN
jgi:hypothetical protein